MTYECIINNHIAEWQNWGKSLVFFIMRVRLSSKLKSVHRFNDYLIVIDRIELELILLGVGSSWGGNIFLGRRDSGFTWQRARMQEFPGSLFGKSYL